MKFSIFKFFISDTFRINRFNLEIKVTCYEHIRKKTFYFNISRKEKDILHPNFQTFK